MLYERQVSCCRSSKVWPTWKVSEKGQVATTWCPQQTTTVPMSPEVSKLEALSTAHSGNMTNLVYTLLHTI